MEPRHELRRRLEEVLGPEAAATIMEHPPWDELARRDEVAALTDDVSVLKSDVAVLKDDVAVLKDDVAGLKSDVAGLKNDIALLKQDVAGLKDDFAGLKVDVAYLKVAFAAMQRDLAMLRSWLEQQFAIVEERREATEHRVLGAIRGEMAGLVSAQTRTIVIALVAAMTANSGMVLAAVRLT
jgi:hypothetical protein